MSENPFVNIFDSLGNVEKTVFREVFGLEEGETHPKKGHNTKAARPGGRAKPSGGGAQHLPPHP